MVKFSPNLESAVALKIVPSQLNKILYKRWVAFKSRENFRVFVKEKERLKPLNVPKIKGFWCVHRDSNPRPLVP